MPKGYSPEIKVTAAKSHTVIDFHSCKLLLQKCGRQFCVRYVRAMLDLQYILTFDPQT